MRASQGLPPLLLAFPLWSHHRSASPSPSVSVTLLQGSQCFHPHCHHCPPPGLFSDIILFFNIFQSFYLTLSYKQNSIILHFNLVPEAFPTQFYPFIYIDISILYLFSCLALLFSFPYFSSYINTIEFFLSKCQDSACKQRFKFILNLLSLTLILPALCNRKQIKPTTRAMLR